MTACLTRSVICCFGAIALASTVSAQTRYTTVVIDAGHGGWDLGTVGRKGLLEKDLVLDIVARLGKLIPEQLD